jgi:ABC-type transport system involved in multi-copper enzyme maturation permease subunit
VIRIIRTEFIRFARLRVLVTTLVGAIAFAVVASTTVLSSAAENVVASRQGGTTLAVLQRSGGGTEAFAVGASFVGFFVFVVFIGLMANEFSGGTFRATLLREPRRVRVIVGKLLGLLAVVALVLASAEVLTLIVSIFVAPGQHVATTEWFTLASLGAGLRDYINVLAGVTGWAIFGTTLAVVFRSAPVALGVGFAWAGPFENIVVDSWKTGFRVFPGQVFGSLIRGGRVELAMLPALLTAAAYAAVAAAVALMLVTRRDVTD